MTLKVVVYSLLVPLCYYNMFEESNFGDLTWTLDCMVGPLIIALVCVWPTCLAYANPRTIFDGPGSIERSVIAMMAAKRREIEIAAFEAVSFYRNFWLFASRLGAYMGRRKEYNGETPNSIIKDLSLGC